MSPAQWAARIVAGIAAGIAARIATQRIKTIYATMSLKLQSPKLSQETWVRMFCDKMC